MWSYSFAKKLGIALIKSGSNIAARFTHAVIVTALRLKWHYSFRIYRLQCQTSFIFLGSLFLPVCFSCSIWAVCFSFNLISRLEVAGLGDRLVTRAFHPLRTRFPSYPLLTRIYLYIIVYNSVIDQASFSSIVFPTCFTLEPLARAVSWSSSRLARAGS